MSAEAAKATEQLSMTPQAMRHQIANAMESSPKSMSVGSTPMQTPQQSPQPMSINSSLHATPMSVSESAYVPQFPPVPQFDRSVSGISPPAKMARKQAGPTAAQASEAGE
eukprot:1419239-Karenia_brevis.AAC.1